jgi:protein-S-isoprenylcysteine O-methyltransferase Ste14
MRVALFIVLSIFLVFYSRQSLRSPKSHGFYRFFAWEAMSVLILLNLNYWFFQPFRIHQIISWLLLIASLFLVIEGVRLLRVVEKSESERSDPSLKGFEKTTELVKTGIYRYIRHPLYSSLLFLCWGAFFKHPDWSGAGLAVVATFFLTVTAKIEEAENIRFWGDTYREYMKQTRTFIPYLF